LGLIKESEPNEKVTHVAARILERVGVDPLEILKEVERQPPGPFPHCEIEPAETILTPRGRNVLNLAIEDSRQRGNTYVGSEHLLVGLIRGGGIAERVLVGLGATFERVNAEIVDMQELAFEAWAQKGGAQSSGS